MWAFFSYLQAVSHPMLIYLYIYFLEWQLYLLRKQIRYRRDVLTQCLSHLETDPTERETQRKPQGVIHLPGFIYRRIKPHITQFREENLILTHCLDDWFGVHVIGFFSFNYFILFGRWLILVLVIRHQSLRFLIFNYKKLFNQVN